MIDRRKSIRFETDLGASYEVIGELANGRSGVLNLGRGGISLSLDRQIAQGREVEVRLLVPGDTKEIVARTEVAWNKEVAAEDSGRSYVTGLKFKAIDTYDKSLLLDYAYARWLKRIPQPALVA